MSNERNFWELYEEGRAKGNLCIGLDPDLSLIPSSIKGAPEVRIRLFLDSIITAVRDFARYFKIDPAFYPINETSPSLVRWVVERLKFLSPQTPIIYDAKVGGVRHSNEEWAKRIFDELGCDAVTVNPLAGQEDLLPFLERRNKGIFVWCLSSGGGSSEFQEARIRYDNRYPGLARPWYEYVADKVAMDWNRLGDRGNCGLVMGANKPAAIAKIRGMAGDKMPILITGNISLDKENILKQALRAGIGPDGNGETIIVVSRNILFVSPNSDFEKAASERAMALRELMNAVTSAISPILP